MNVVQALLVGATLLLAALAGPALARVEPHSVWDPGPKGLGHLVDHRGARPTLDGVPLVVLEARLQGFPGHGLLVVEPRRGYDAAEVQALARFLERGGTAMLVGGSPALEELLVRLGAGITLGGGVYSPSFLGGAARPLAEGFGRTFAIPEARAVHGGMPLLTTGLAWEDLDRDGGPDLDEPAGTFALAASQAVGQGHLLVVGSASPFTRDGYASGPGPALLDLLRQGSPRGIAVDEAHRTPLDPLGVSGFLAGAPEGWLLAAAVLVVGALLALRPRVHRRGAAPDLPGGARGLVQAAAEARPPPRG
jgi:hypothetical protein